jgi:hypothetical protein
MAVAQVSLVSAVKAVPVRARAGARRSARAVNVVAKAGVSRVEVAKKAAPVALAVGTSPSRSRARSGDRAIGGSRLLRPRARRAMARRIGSRACDPSREPGRFSISPAGRGTARSEPSGLGLATPAVSTRSPSGIAPIGKIAD